MSLHRHLKLLLLKNDGEVLQILLKVFAKNTDNFNQVILKMRELEDLKKERIKETLSADDVNRRQNKIHDSILKLIDLISEDEAAAYELENAIFKPILVVCKSPDRKKEMRKLFPKDVYKGTKIDHSGKPLAADYVNKFKILIFDDYPFDGPDNQTLLIHYLDNTKPYILYFGPPNNKLLFNYPAKAYFTNSVFSLHARLDEMITYLKYFERKE